MTKKCFKCGRVKDLSEFYRHEAMADGYIGKCKVCTRVDVLNNRKKNIDRIRAYDRERSKLPHRKLAMTAIRKKYEEMYPLRTAATTLVNNAVRDGRLPKPFNCEICSSGGRIYGHHEDYYKPLEVIWVCQSCHKLQHKKGS